MKIERIPPEVYNKNYLLSDYLEGYEDFLKGNLSVVKTNELKMLELHQGTTLLEVGVGRGELLKYCAREGARVTGIDYSKDAIEIAEKTLEGIPGVCLRVADCKNLPYQSNSFERVFAGDVIEHMCSPEGLIMLKEMYRVLTPGGFLLVHTTPNTVFTKLVYPVGKYLMRLINKQIIDAIDHNLYVYPKVHVTEYNLISLTRLAKKAGLKNARVWLSKDILRSSKHRYTRDFGKNPLVRLLGYAGKFGIIRFFFGNDLYLKCYKKI